MFANTEDRVKAQEALDAFYYMGKSKTEAAKFLHIPYETLRNRMNRAVQEGLTASTKTVDPEKKRLSELRKELFEMRAHMRELEEKAVDIEKVKEIIHDCKVKQLEPPSWTMPKTTGVNTGIPFLFLSDWHWDEVIFAEQVNYVNAFNRKIAIRRAKMCFEKTTDLLINHMAKPDYPHIVVGLGGDMLSGNIHEELRETNEAPIAKSIMNLLENMIAGFDLLVTHFGKVLVYAIPGNHGRFDKKPRFKNKVYDNFEWLFYQLLARHYRGDDRFHFKISDSTDCFFNIYNTTYLMTHGDQFKGGDGISGIFSPIVRGDAKKRKRYMAMKQMYDILICGHFHQHITPSRGTLVNGSLKGYDEYAMEHNFDFDIPTQAMWLTHPVWGVTARWPIYLEKSGTMFT